MNAPATIPTDTLPTLIDRATAALDSARTSAEVLEARDMARVAYDAAKSAARIAKAKGAHDDMIGMAYRLQADAALIEARAKVRLADEYDAAQERGEVRKAGNPIQSGQTELPGAEIVGGENALKEARQFRNAEQAEPGLAERALNAMVERGEEPTRAALRRSVIDAIKDTGRRPSNRNPHHVPDARRDRVINFTGECARIADADDLSELAAFDGHPAFRQQMLQQARAAHGALTRFLNMVDEN